LDKTPPEDQHLLLPPDNVPASWLARSARRGKRPKTRSKLSSTSFLEERVYPPISRFFPDAHVGEDAPTLRYVGDPQPRDPVGRETCDRFPVVHDAPRGGTDDTGERPQGGALPGPVRADESDDLPLPTVKETSRIAWTAP